MSFAFMCENVCESVLMSGLSATTKAFLGDLHHGLILIMVMIMLVIVIIISLPQTLRLSGPEL